MKNCPTPSPRGVGFQLLLTALLAALVLASAAGAQSLPTFQKAFAPATIGPGSTSALTFTIDNSGGGVGVRNLDFTDTLPAGVALASPANPSSTCSGGTLTAADGGSTISFTGGGVGAGTSCTISVDVTSSTPGTHTNVSGDLTSDAGNSGSATANLTVDTGRPGFTKSFSPSSAFFGNRTTLTFTIDNTASSTNAYRLTFTDNLPTGFEVASPSNATTDCGAVLITATAGSSVIGVSPDFSSPSVGVAAGASCTVSVDVIAGAVGVIGNTTGELTSATQTLVTRSSGKASATITVTVEQISISKSFTDDPLAPGATGTLEFTIRNLDRRSDATGISFTDDLDAALSGLVATSLPANPCGAGSSLTGSGLLTFSGGSLAVGESCTFSVSVTVPAGATPGSYTNTTSSITADFGGSPATGDPASDVLFVSAVPLLTKTFVGDPVGAGGSVDLEFSITNTSSTSSATDISFADELTTFLPFPVSVSLPSSGFCGTGSSVLLISFGSERQGLLMTGGTLAAGASCSFTVTLSLPDSLGAGPHTNTTQAITATIDGETVTGDPASDSFLVVGAPELRKEFIDDPAQPGGTVTLQFTLFNSEENPGSATDITFTDDLDATLSGLVATGLPATDVCGIGSQIDGTMTLTFSGGSLAPGESCTFNVTLDVPSDAVAGDHTNTTSAIVASVLGESTTGNTASDDLGIAGLELTKEFIDDPALPGGTVTLEFTISNISPTADATGITFSDNLRIFGGSLFLTPSGLPASDICGAGSSLSFVSSSLFFTSGSLTAGTSCTFDVTLTVPAGVADDSYTNTTSNLSATVGGVTAVFDPATDQLTVSSELVLLTKEFTDDPVSPGENVNLRFTLSNLDESRPVTDLAFTDDLDAALSGLTATGVAASSCGGTVSGTSTISFSGGSLAAGASCSIDVTLLVPAATEPGTVATNTTSEVTGTIAGGTVTGQPATDELSIEFLVLSKSFDGPIDAGSTGVLTFNIRNLSTTETVSRLGFTDDLDAVVSGLVATGLPQFDVCGSGSEVSGTSLIALSGGSLLPGGSCTFGVDVSVPAATEPGSYLNTTSELQENGLPVAPAATATLEVTEPPEDTDGDGVLDADDVCDDTVIPESVPTVRLGVNRFALVNDDGLFDTMPPNGNGPGDVYTIEDTAGCSCEQIIVAQGLGKGHQKYGCSLSAMRDWVALVNP